MERHQLQRTQRPPRGSISGRGIKHCFRVDNLGDKIIHEALLKKLPIIDSYLYPILEMNTHDGIGRASKRLLSNVDRCFVTGGNSVPTESTLA